MSETPKAKAEARKSMPETMKRMDEFIGLKRAKEKFVSMVAMARYTEELERRGADVSGTALNMVFEGPPGTGKTEMARLFGDALHEQGVLPGRNGKPVFQEVSAATLKGKFEGQTVPMVTAAFEAAKGGVLFVDEANLWVTGDSAFGTEAMTHLMKLAEDNRDDTIVILGGYPGMKKHLGSIDPGLPRRFPETVPFDLPTEKEMVDVSASMFKKSGHRMTPKARKDLLAVMGQMRQVHPGASAGDVRNFNADIMTSISMRFDRAKNPEGFDVFKVTPADVAYAARRWRGGKENKPLPLGG